MSISTALIVTLQMEQQAAARYTLMRQAHFPADRNWLAAHVTLFHALPVGSVEAVLSDAADFADSTARFVMQVDRVLFLGRGVAYQLRSPEGLRLRQALAERWDALLGRQDRAWQGRLHVTIQNKVDASTARALHAQLERDFVPEDVGATGLEVWHYLGGPWRLVEAFSFQRSAA